MISQKRYDAILKLLAAKGTITLTELVENLQVSESTIRRDLLALDKLGKLRRIHGGATRVDLYLSEEMNLATKADLATGEKNLIAQYAAGLVEPKDLIYIDAGTTTDLIIKYLRERNAIYVTNGLSQAKNLIAAGFRCFILAGELKDSTGAIIGSYALTSLKSYNFTKGFFGTNGISIGAGYSTPDPVEACVKREAMLRCQQPFILADSGKFDCTASISFGNLAQAKIITDKLHHQDYRKYTEIIETA